MADEGLSPTDFMIQKMSELDDITQVLIVMRSADGTICYDTVGQVCSDTLGMLAFVQVAVKEYLRREFFEIADGED